MVPEFLRHGADGCADVEVVFVVGVAELGEHGGGEVLAKLSCQRRSLHIDGIHGRRNEMRGGDGGGGFRVLWATIQSVVRGS